MKKILLTLSFLIVTAFTSQFANAALLNGSTLSYTPAATGGTVMPAPGTGSWFSMQVTPMTSIYTPIQSLNGIVLGTTQPADSIIPLQGDIEIPWTFSANNGTHQTLSDSNVLSTVGDTATLDFSGWNITWNGIPSINMGTGAWNGNADGVADVVCQGGSGCGNGASYILDYSATVPMGDPSGYVGAPYALHLEGTISAVPVPAAIWLFGSGMVGLLGFARHRKLNMN